ncbi:MAG: hypothetical protein F4061_00680 [Acidobacteria bacterium]|nr:hypothetical protein [Acidobacteriota bacterium]
MTVLSSRADTVTGPEALLRIDVPAGVALDNVRVTVNGADATVAFRADAERHRLVGLIEGLTPGSNRVSVTAAGAGAGETSLALIAHPVQGPVISGPHEQPFVCETDAFELPSGETLGAPLDEHCSIARRVDYAYRAAGDPELRPLADPATVPSDAAMTTTLTGDEVPYVVRIETGTINRAVYQIAMLHAPGAGDAAPDAWTPSPGWNRRLIYTFGGGCVRGWYRQGATTGGVTDDVMLRQGYAVASASLNVYGNNCNDLLAAETMMMVKERFIEAYGLPRYTIGWGCSGGSYQNHQIADNYPGLLDGIIPGCSFPDVTSGTVPMVTDARLLNRYFSETAAVEFTEEEQQAVAGFLNLATMPNVSLNAGRITVGEFCPDVLPEELRYHPTDNPDGARCDMFSHYANVFGRDPETGFVRRPLDNTGVQYGLGALNDGAITVEQFLDLNRRVGGFDQDGAFSPERSVADPEAVRAAYETGRLANGGGGLAGTPIIDYRAYSDDREGGDVHVRYHSFSMRERLRRANGRADNHIMLVEDARHGLYSSQSPVLQGALAQMDEWLANLTADESAERGIDDVVGAKPVELADACWTRDESPERILEEQVRGRGRCEELYPSSPGPREVAGAPLASDVIKCVLRPIDMTDYEATFTDEQEAELRQVFEGGVCDWTEPGIGQTDLAGTWQSF